MSYPLPNSDSLQEPPREFRWTKLDLAMFALFFALTVLLLPVGAIWVMRIFRPDFTVSDLTGVEQVLLQGVMDLLLIGFIFFIIKVVHGLSFLGTIQWTR